MDPRRRAPRAASATVEQAFTDVTLGDIMQPNPPIVPDWITIDDLGRSLPPTTRHRAFPVQSHDGRITGLLTAEQLVHTDAWHRAHTPVAQLAFPIDRVTWAARIRHRARRPCGASPGRACRPSSSSGPTAASRARSANRSSTRRTAGVAGTPSARAARVRGWRSARPATLAGMTDLAALSYHLDGDVAVLTLDDGKANAVSPALLEALNGALDRARDEARAVVLAGRPGKFSAGFDLSVMTQSTEAMRDLVQSGAELLLRWYEYDLPTVAACTVTRSPREPCCC